MIQSLHVIQPLQQQGRTKFFCPAGDFQGQKNFVQPFFRRGRENEQTKFFWPSFPLSSERGPNKMFLALEATTRAKINLFSPLSEEGGKERGGDKQWYFFALLALLKSVLSA